jgi:hypothetical protein
LAYAAHSYSRVPSTILQDQWMKFIAETGQPELIQELNHGPIPKDANYKILKRVYIDRKKRPNRDMVACLMCYAKNKFLRGSLVFIYDMNISAVIGRCCANNVDMAEREYNADRLLYWQEDYLIDALPYVTEKIETVNQLRPFAEELQRIHRKIRRDASSFHGTLRSLKDRNNALSLSLRMSRGLLTMITLVRPVSPAPGLSGERERYISEPSEEQLWRSTTINRLWS